MATRITKEQQQALGFNNANDFDTALTNFENAGGNTASTFGENSNIMTPENLTPGQLINIPPTTPTTGISNELGRLESAVTQQDTFIKDQEKKTQELKQEKDTSSRDLINSILGSPTQSKLENEAFSVAGGVDDIGEELRDINDQLKSEQHALRREIEQIQSGAGTATAAQRNNSVQEAQRQSFRKQADLSVIQQSIQGRFDSAKDIADRAVNAQMEFYQKKIDVMGLIYQDSKESFSKNDQRLFESKQADRKFQLEEIAYRERAKFDQILSQQDPLYQLQVIKARKELELMGQQSEKERKAEIEALKQAEQAVPALNNKLNLIDGLLTSPALDSVVGTSIFSRAAGGIKGVAGRILGTAATGFATGATVGSVVPGPGTLAGGLAGGAAGLIGGIGIASQGAKDVLTGDRQNFIAGVNQLVDKEFLDNLINVKAQGATFGALSDAEGQALRSAATKIGTWAIRDKNGNVLGYNASEADFTRELNTIRDLTRTAYEKASGQLLTPDEQDFFNTLNESSLSGFEASNYYGI